MLNVATNSAIPANTTRKVVMNPRKSALMSETASSAAAVPVSASLPEPITGSIRFSNASSVTPRSAATAIWLTCPGSRVRCAAVPDSEKNAYVTPTLLDPSPNSAMPTMVTSRGVGMSSVAVPFNFSLPVSTVSSSRMTSSGPSGARPLTRLYGLRPSSGSQLAASVGGPLPPMRSPSAPMTWAKPVV